MEGNLEYADDDGDSYIQTKRLNILLTDTGFGSSASRSSTPAPVLSSSRAKRLFGEKGRSIHFRCLQHILKLILPRVVSELYPDLKDALFETNLTTVTGFMWLKFANHTFKTSTPLILDLYVLIYLSLRKLNQYPVYVDEFLELLKHNRVPFVNASTLVPGAWLKTLPTALMSMLSASSVPVTNQFYKRIARLAHALGTPESWATPPEYFYPNVFRLFVDLALDDAPLLLVMFHRIASRITHGLMSVTLPTIEVRSLPEARYIGMAFLVIKLYFVGAPDVVDLEDWLAWLQHQHSELACFDHNTHSMDIGTILDLSDSQITKYYDWVYENLTPSRRKDGEEEELTMMERKLLRIFDYDPKSEQREVQDTAAHKQIGYPEPPFDTVPNYLSTKEIQSMEGHLQKYLCIRYGLREDTMKDLALRTERIFYKTMEKDELLVI